MGNVNVTASRVASVKRCQGLETRFLLDALFNLRECCEDPEQQEQVLKSQGLVVHNQDEEDENYEEFWRPSLDLPKHDDHLQHEPAGAVLLMDIASSHEDDEVREMCTASLLALANNTVLLPYLIHQGLLTLAVLLMGDVRLNLALEALKILTIIATLPEGQMEVVESGGKKKKGLERN